MDTSFYAKPDCKLCHGRGRVRTGERMGQEAICLCAIASKRQEDAERIIKLRFPGITQEMTLDTFQTGGRALNEQALTAAKNFVDLYQEMADSGAILGFWGPPAAGKTHLAVGVAQECVRRYLARPMLFNVPKELRRERERFRSDIDPANSPIDMAMRAELLVLDDFGAEYQRAGTNSQAVSWVQEQLYQILDERFMERRPTILTSNLSMSDLERNFSSEAASRILSRIERAIVGPLLEVVPVPSANHQHDELAAALMKPRADVIRGASA